jgi:hypothetical protein
VQFNVVNVSTPIKGWCVNVNYLALGIPALVRVLVGACTSPIRPDNDAVEGRVPADEFGRTTADDDDAALTVVAAVDVVGGVDDLAAVFASIPVLVDELVLESPISAFHIRHVLSLEPVIIVSIIDTTQCIITRGCNCSNVYGYIIS